MTNTFKAKTLIDKITTILMIQQYISYIMATSVSGGRSRRDPSTMGKQLVNFITCSCESSAVFCLSSSCVPYVVSFCGLSIFHLTFIYCIFPGTCIYIFIISFYFFQIRHHYYYLGYISSRNAHLWHVP